MKAIQKSFDELKDTLIHYYKQNPTKFSMLLSVMLVAILSLSYWLQPSKAHSTNSEEQSQNWEQALMEHLPEGSTFVPLNLINNESIAKMISDVGYLDLYLFEAESKKKQKIAKNLKVVKIDNDEGAQFLAIVSENNETLINKLQNEVFGIIKSPRRSQPNARQKQLKSSILRIRGEQL